MLVDGGGIGGVLGVLAFAFSAFAFVWTDGNDELSSKLYVGPCASTSTTRSVYLRYLAGLQELESFAPIKDT